MLLLAIRLCYFASRFEIDGANFGLFWPFLTFFDGCAQKFFGVLFLKGGKL
jgi:hypothetical protein